MRFPGGAALNCWDGGAAQTASSGMVDRSLVTKVNLFYNGTCWRETWKKWWTWWVGSTTTGPKMQSSAKSVSGLDVHRNLNQTLHQHALN